MDDQRCSLAEPEVIARDSSKRFKLSILTQSWCSAFEGNISLSQCCGSGMFIPDLDFYPPRIPDLGSRILDPKIATKERGEKKFVKPFFVATNFTKLNIH
jgi:hypothetical protein